MLLLFVAQLVLASKLYTAKVVDIFRRGSPNTQSPLDMPPVHTNTPELVVSLSFIQHRGDVTHRR